MAEESFRIVESSYLLSAVKLSQCKKDDLKEIAFIGRSNVGKSSLINSLCNHRGLAMVSREPGKTRTINYFSIRSKQAVDGAGDAGESEQNWYLVDLPGYGFAKTSHENRDAWSGFIADYAANSRHLALMCLLIDLRHPQLPIDKKAYQWLRGLGMPLQVIGTKADKLGQSDRQKNIRTIAHEYPGDYPPLMYSSKNHLNRQALLQVIQGFVVDPQEASHA